MKKVLEVTLSKEEGLMASVSGAVQMMRATERGWVGNDHGGSSGRDLRERWAQAIHGAMCEFAWAKLQDVFPISSTEGISGRDPGDVAVRGTPWANGCLIVNKSEACSDTPYVLVCGHWPKFRFPGWMNASDVVEKRWWRPEERPPSFWVPQEALWPIRDLLGRTKEVAQ